MVRNVILGHVRDISDNVVATPGDTRATIMDKKQNLGQITRFSRVSVCGRKATKADSF